jgi:hypothetical protein
VTDEWERVLREASVAYFKGTIQHLPGATEKNHDYFTQDSRYLGRELNPSLQNTQFVSYCVLAIMTPDNEQAASYSEKKFVRNHCAFR